MHKRVVLVNPNRLRPGVPPIALDYLAAALDRRGIGARVLDLCHARKPVEEIRRFFRHQASDLIGITVRNMDDVVYNCFLSREVKVLIDEIKRSASAPIVLGGSGFSIAPELMLDYFGVDLGVVGEGEEAICLLAEGADLSDVPGLIRRTDEGIRRNPMGSADLASLHAARRAWIRHSDYGYRGRRGSEGGRFRTKGRGGQRFSVCKKPG